jgi:general stress protein 26
LDAALISQRSLYMKEQQHDNPATPEQVRERVWELAEKIDICMFTTWDGHQQQSRPMSARPRPKEGVFYFLTDVQGEKNSQVAEFPTVSLAWADNSKYRGGKMPMTQPSGC